jgi:hypothetical protein
VQGGLGKADELLLETLTAHNPRQQIRQAVSRENHPPIGNPARTDNVPRRKHGSRCNRRAVLICRSRTTNPPTIAVSDLCRNPVPLKLIGTGSGYRPDYRG